MLTSGIYREAGSNSVSASGVYTQIAVPGALDAYASAVNDAGVVAGLYDDESGPHGFTLDKGVST
jgi:hypothetical protein